MSAEQGASRATRYILESTALGAMSARYAVSVRHQMPGHPIVFAAHFHGVHAQDYFSPAQARQLGEHLVEAAELAELELSGRPELSKRESRR